MTRGRLVVHGHFYQPLRVDPFTGLQPRDAGAAPFHDWNERIDAECYRPNVQRGNIARISFDVGPTLATWLKVADPTTYDGFIHADRPDPTDPGGQGNAMAQSFHHTILPLASLADRRTEIRWGIRDFELRFGRRPDGLWLPETAVDLPTLRLMAAEGIRYTILAPWQAADPGLDTHRLHQVALGGGRAITVVFYDAPLSGAVSFDPGATADADAFIRDRLLPSFTPRARTQLVGVADVSPAGSGASSGATSTTREGSRRPVGRGPGPDGEDQPLIVIATDGELYGHHQKFRDLFLHRLVAPEDTAGIAWGSPPAGAASTSASTAGIAPRRPTIGADRGFDLVTLANLVAELDPAAAPQARIVERTSWSCHHGVARWSAECPDATDGRWKGPLRAALERLAAGIDATVTDLARREAAGFDLWAARDAYVDVVVGLDAEAGGAFTERWLGKVRSKIARERMLQVMEAQRWRLAMFASDAWFWDDPIRTETMQVLREAARATRIVDQLAGTDLEDRLMDDLTLFTSPSRGIDGAAIYREAIAGVGQAAD